MKYRRLNLSELKALEKEFIDFLASNSIVADDWEKLKKAKTGKAEQLLDIFSDIAFEKILGKIGYLQRYSDFEVVLYKCGLKSFKLILIRSSGNLILNTEEALTSTLADPQKFSQLTLYKAMKAVADDRKKEIFNLMETGAVPCTSLIFEELRGKLNV